VKQRRNACLVDVLLVIGQKMTVEVLCLAQAIAKYTLNLRTALNHFLTHSQLSIFNLLYLSQLVSNLKVSLVAAAESVLHFQE